MKKSLFPNNSYILIKEISTMQSNVIDLIRFSIKIQKIMLKANTSIIIYCFKDTSFHDFTTIWCAIPTRFVLIIFHRGWKNNEIPNNLDNQNHEFLICVIALVNLRAWNKNNIWNQSIFMTFMNMKYFEINISWHLV